MSAPRLIGKPSSHDLLSADREDTSSMTQNSSAKVIKKSDISNQIKLRLLSFLLN
jgi:hypothetical protein